MPLRLEIKRKLSARSERVKCCDFHPTEPWVLAALYSGHVFIWNSQTQTLVKSLEVCDLPVRCARFIPRKQWIICGSDDMQIRVYNYNTMEKVKTFEAHTDYIRSLAIHPTLPLVLSSSDDMFIKLWDWEKGWECTTLFEGHTHYVMQVEFNPKDSNTFASASLDRTVKVWGLNSATPHFSLEGHERGVNCVGYFRGGDRPYLVSGADDHLVKIWDYQTKTCVATLDGHTNNVSAVCFHPELPIIISGSEDGTVRLWHATTYRLENTLNYGMERVWSISCLKGSNKVALGYDDGTIVIKLGHEEPVVSMERNGRILWAKNHDIVIGNLKAIESKEITDGDRLPISTKDLGSCDVYPQRLMHSRDGRFVCACGDGQYIIYTALKLANKSFGDAMEFCWASDSGVYATRESSSKIKVFKSFKQHKQFRPPFAAEGIFGGALLGVRSGEFIDFYDWAECRIVRRIDVCPRKVYWSESGDVVVLACDTSFYVLRYNRDLVNKYFDQGVEATEQGIDKAFDLEEEVPEKVRNGHFVGDCFIYTNSGNRLNYYVGGETMTLAHLAGKSMYLLGYLPKENRVYLMDKSHNVYSYSLLVSVLVYQTAIVRRDFEAAARALAGIPADHHNRIARFLEAQDLKELALEVSNDPEHKFELAMSTKKLTLARDILLEAESEQKWKQLGDAALNQEFDLKLAEECFARSKDLGGLLLLYTSLGDADGLNRLAKMANDQGRHNIAFVCLLLLHRLEDCVNLLCTTDRIPEAAFMTRTYLPSHISRVLALWKANLKLVNLKASESLADPAEYGEELFPDLGMGIKAEKFMAAARRVLPLAASYPSVKPSIFRNIVNELKDGSLTFDEKDIAPLPIEPEVKSPVAVAVNRPVTTPSAAAPVTPVEAKRPAASPNAASTPVATTATAAPVTPKAAIPISAIPVVASPAVTARPVAPSPSSVANTAASVAATPLSPVASVRPATTTAAVPASPSAVSPTTSSSSSSIASTPTRVSPIALSSSSLPSPAKASTPVVPSTPPPVAAAAARPVSSPIAAVTPISAAAAVPVAVVAAKVAAKPAVASLLDDDELDVPVTSGGTTAPPTAAELDAMLNDDTWGDNF